MFDLLSTRKISHQNYWLNCTPSIKNLISRSCFFFNFLTIFK